MQRVVDIDLDFFVQEVACFRAYEAERLDGEEFPPWDIAAALGFLENHCGLTGRLPGYVVERHGELFGRWRDAIDAGVLTPPFSVTHVDAHADLGLGDAGYMHLMSELLFQPVERRRFPKAGPLGLDDGNWLSFAIACRWIGELTYVFNRSDPDPGDILVYVMEGFDMNAAHIQLPAIRKADLDEVLWTRPFEMPVVQHYEPKVPFRALPWPAFQAAEPFDVVCLARSPAFTPAESDPLFDEIRERFIEAIRPQ